MYMSCTYGPVDSTETHGVGYTPHRRGEGEVVIIAVDHTCSPDPPWAIVGVIIMTRSIAVEAEIEARMAMLESPVLKKAR